MTKEIREGIKAVLIQQLFLGIPSQVDAILGYLHSKGCVIKVDRELPKNPWSHKGIRTIRGRITDPTELQFCAYSLAKKDMADRVAVEELI